MQNLYCILYTLVVSFSLLILCVLFQIYMIWTLLVAKAILNDVSPRLSIRTICVSCCLPKLSLIYSWAEYVSVVYLIHTNTSSCTAEKRYF